MSSLVVDAANNTAFNVTWMSPDPSVKNGIVILYFVIVHLHSSKATIESLKFSVEESFSDTATYTAAVTGLGKCEWEQEA